MSELEVINNLQKKLAEYEETTMELKRHCDELSELLGQGQFVSDDLVESIRVYLAAAGINQKSIFEEYEWLDIGDAPEDINQMKEMLSLCMDEMTEEVDENGFVAGKQSMFTPENEQLLHIEEASCAQTEVSLKDFKSDMQRLLLGRKLECLVEAFVSDGYSIPGITAMKHDRHQELKRATERLYQQGYLRRYTVEGMDDFYTLSDRGMSAFREESALNFMNHYMKYNVTPVFEHSSQMTVNDAIIRLLACETYIRQIMLKPSYRFSVKYAVRGSDYFIQGYPELRRRYTIWFAGIVSEQIEQFQEMFTQLSENMKTGDILVITGPTIAQAKETVNWIRRQLGKKSLQFKFGYCRYDDENIFEE